MPHASNMPAYSLAMSLQPLGDLEQRAVVRGPQGPQSQGLSAPGRPAGDLDQVSPVQAEISQSLRPVAGRADHGQGDTHLARQTTNTSGSTAETASDQRLVSPITQLARGYAETSMSARQRSNHREQWARVAQASSDPLAASTDSTSTAGSRQGVGSRAARLSHGRVDSSAIRHQPRQSTATEQEARRAILVRLAVQNDNSASTWRTASTLSNQHMGTRSISPRSAGSEGTPPPSVLGGRHAPRQAQHGGPPPRTVNTVNEAAQRLAELDAVLANMSGSTA